jgi:DNA-binding response OmpR family regulator
LRAFSRKPLVSLDAHRESSGTARIAVLAVIQQPADRSLLDEIAQRHRWKMALASSREEARDCLPRIEPQIILFDRDGDPIDWRSAVSSLAAASNGACVLLISRVVDEYLWNEVVSNGGYDVVRKPLREDDLLRNVKLAWSYWNGTRRTRASATK